MAWVPIVLPPSGIGLLRPQRLPDHLRPAHAYYRRYDPQTGHRSEFKWHYDAAKDIPGKMTRDGVDYWIYAVDKLNNFFQRFSEKYQNYRIKYTNSNKII